MFSFDTNEELWKKTKEISPDYIIKSDQWKDNVVGSDLAKVIYFNTLKNFSTSKIIERVFSTYDRLSDKSHISYPTEWTQCTCSLMIVNGRWEHAEDCYDRKYKRGSQ